MINPLNDKEFIKKLDKNHQRELYAKIISLTTDELPVEEISGQVSQGTISIDGTSAVRRTCSLTIVADRVNINEYYWSFTTKFKLLIGLKVPDDLKLEEKQRLGYTIDNETGKPVLNGAVEYKYQEYPDIVWFPQGIFVITDFKYINNTNGTDNIYISGKDKMALLNGDIGGHLPHATDFGIEEIYTYDEVTGRQIDKTETDLTIKQIIREMIHKYGNEPFHNIVINDLDDNGLQLLDYKGKEDIYLFKNVNSGLYEQISFDGDITRYDYKNQPVILSEMDETVDLDTLSSTFIKKSAKKVKATDSLADKVFYTIVKCGYGSVLGYRTTDFTYPGDFIMKPGDTITQALDKIVKTFGDEYEYFYNLDGQFVFQKKMTYVNTSWNSLTDTWESNENNELIKSVYAESAKLVSQVEYSFIGGEMTTTFNNTPNISNIRNDYAIWGKKKSNSEGKDNAIHMRVAIDEKPENYKAFDGTMYTSDKWDWRELIYQMAKDFYKHNHDDDFDVVLHQNNPGYKFGKTGYEQYYTDLLGFWRLLYNPQPPDENTYDTDLYSSYEEAMKVYQDTYIVTKDKSQTDAEFNQMKYWNRLVFSDPASLLFWFDFLDANVGNLNKYSVKAIGDRTKVINDDDIKAIYYGEVPNLIYITTEKYEELKSVNMLNDGYTYILLPEVMEEYFDVSFKNKSCQDELDNLIYQYAYCNESIQINSIPVFHLEPNMKISVFDEKTKINGEYIVNKIVIPLGHNGQMQIMATRAPIRLF